ncbi:MAG: hypothetical protein ACFN4N_01795, partial [Streptococcus sp.]
PADLFNGYPKTKEWPGPVDIFNGHLKTKEWPDPADLFNPSPEILSRVNSRKRKSYGIYN